MEFRLFRRPTKKQEICPTIPIIPVEKEEEEEAVIESTESQPQRNIISSWQCIEEKQKEDYMIYCLWYIFVIVLLYIYIYIYIYTFQ